MEGRAYENPGRIFIDRYPPPDLGRDLYRYVDQYAHFLRERSGVGHNPPIDLDKICQYFGVTVADISPRTILDGASSTQLGVILINEGSSETRRRFTTGHELVELLFSRLKEVKVSDNVWRHLNGAEKEILCNSGAAALLMPFSFLQASLQDEGVSVLSVRSLAKSLRTSFLATLISAVRHHQRPYAVVAWKNMLKPAEQERLVDGRQLSFGGDFEEPIPPKLRVLWTIRSRAHGLPYVPRHKSIPEDSIIYQCYREGRDLSGSECIDLGRSEPIRCFIEAVVQHPSSDLDVLTLITWSLKSSNREVLALSFHEHS